MNRMLMAYLASVAAAAALGSIVQTLVNLAALEALGLEVPLLDWLGTVGHDLLNFAPLYAVVVAAAFLPAFLVAGALAQRLPPRYRAALFAVAGAGGILAAIVLMNSLLPMTVLAATRFVGGTLGMAIAGGIGGWIYALVSTPRAVFEREPA